MPRTTIDRFEQRKLTRAKLVDAALQLFSTSGYEHATVDDISQAAGYSKGAYYFHFSTKDDILLELLRIWTEDRSARARRRRRADGDGRATTLHADAGELLLVRRRAAVAGRAAGVLGAGRAQPEVSKRLTRRTPAGASSSPTPSRLPPAAGALHVASAEDAAAVALAAHDGYAVQIAIGSPGGKAMTPAELADSLLAPLETAAAIRRPPRRRPLIDSRSASCVISWRPGGRCRARPDPRPVLRPPARPRCARARRRRVRELARHEPPPGSRRTRRAARRRRHRRARSSRRTSSSKRCSRRRRACGSSASAATR